MRDPRGASDAQSWAPVDLDPTEAIAVAGAGIQKGQACHSPGADGRTEAKELRGTALLGARLLGLDRGPQCGGGAEGHSRSGKGRPASRSVGTPREPKPLGAVHNLKTPALPLSMTWAPALLAPSGYLRRLHQAVWRN